MVIALETRAVRRAAEFFAGMGLMRSGLTSASGLTYRVWQLDMFAKLVFSLYNNLFPKCSLTISIADRLSMFLPISARTPTCPPTTRASARQLMIFPEAGARADGQIELAT